MPKFFYFYGREGAVTSLSRFSRFAGASLRLVIHGNAALLGVDGGCSSPSSHPASRRLLVGRSRTGSS